MTGAAPQRVVIAGAGVAGLEMMLALARTAGPRVQISLVAPQDGFDYRPLSVLEPFDDGVAPRFDLREVASDCGAEFVHEALASFDLERRRILTESGVDLEYDIAVVATGAQAQSAIEDAITFRGSVDTPLFAQLLSELEQGTTQRVAFVVPTGVVWPLPIYELALKTAGWVKEHGIRGVAIALVTCEQSPLRLFGRRASDQIAEMLERDGIALHTSAHLREIRDDRLTIMADGQVVAQRIVAAPRLRGRDIPGLPQDPNGFLRTDGFGLVEQTENVYAIGDITSFPVKQGGIATQQADAAAAAIASRCGAEVDVVPFRPVLRGILVSDQGAEYLRADVAGGLGDNSEISKDPLWQPPGKIVGRHLSGYLAERLAARGD